MAKGIVTYALPEGFRLRSKDRTYEIVKVLGSGSFGITYLATSEITIGNINMTAKFAIKEHFIAASCFRGDDGTTVKAVPTAKNDVESSRADFLTEANRLKRICLKSRNIVSVNEAFEANGTAYYVMEFLDGGNPGQSPEHTAVEIVRQIAEALQHIHAENVLHLDVKPDNIVLKTNKRGETYPVLIDFGISKHFDTKGRPTSSLSAKGASQGYAPQEQYAGISEFSPKYDIYALGGVLFYLLTGKNPPDAFKISPNQQELKKELEGKVSPKIEKALLHAMNPSAMERTPDIENFLEELNSVEFKPSLKLDTSHLDFGKGKNKGEVKIESNIEWQVSSNASWCKVTRDGNHISVSVPSNKDRGSRCCEITVWNDTFHISQHLQVNQQGKGTIVIQDTWWERNKKNVLISAAGVVALSGIILACVFIGGNTYKQEEQITEVDNVDIETVSPDVEDAQPVTQQTDPVENHTKQMGQIQATSQQNQSVNTQAKPHQGLSVINEQKKPIMDELFAQAKTIEDYKSLADRGYAKAYAPLAELYLKANNYNEANQMALKAGQSKTGMEKARKVASILNSLGYYDDKPEIKNQVINTLGKI